MKENNEEAGLTTKAWVVLHHYLNLYLDVHSWMALLVSHLVQIEVVALELGRTIFYMSCKINTKLAG